MAEMLRKLFKGELDPDGRLIRDRNEGEPSRYWENMKQVTEAEKALCATFTEKQKELFERYQTLAYDIENFDREERFSYGFRLGMLLAMEACEISDKYIE